MDSGTYQEIKHKYIRKRSRCIAIVLLSLIGLFYWSSVRPGHDWGGDFALYLLHAKNIAEHHDYSDTTWIYNPHLKSLSPKTYPPVVPALLSSVYRLHGLNFQALKSFQIFIFLLFLYFFWQFLKERLSLRYALYGLAVIGFLPFFFGFLNEIRSDIPFLLFWFLAMYEVDRVHLLKQERTINMFHIVITGALIYIAYGTRSIGLVVLISMVVYDFFVRRRVTLYTIGSSLIAMFLLLLQSKVFHNDGSYFDNLAQTNIWLIKHNVIGLPRFFAGLVRNYQFPVLTYLLFSIVMVLAMYGFYTAIRRRITIWNVFVPIYLVIVFLWPAYQGGRFLIPLIPLFVYYVLIATQQLLKNPAWHRQLFVVVLIGLLSWSYVGQYNELRKDFHNFGVESNQAMNLFEFIRNNTHAHDRFVFYKPRILALMTGRAGFATHTPEDTAAVWSYWRQQGVNYIIVARESTDDYDFLRSMYSDFSNAFTSVFKNTSFEVYAINYE